MTLEDWKRRQAVRRIKAGDGRPLQRFRWWQLVEGRKLFYLRLPDQDGREVAYAVDVRHWGTQAGDDGKAHLYLDGRHLAESTLPAAFPVVGGTVEVALTEYGLKRMHYVTTEGAEQQLVPDPRSAIGRRRRLDREHPMASRWIGAVSLLVLVVGLGPNLLQGLESISEIPAVAERFGRFESPVSLPLWLNVTLGVGAGVASMERALRFKYHWLLD